MSQGQNEVVQTGCSSPNQPAIQAIKMEPVKVVAKRTLFAELRIDLCVAAASETAAVYRYLQTPRQTPMATLSVN